MEVRKSLIHNSTAQKGIPGMRGGQGCGEVLNSDLAHMESVNSPIKLSTPSRVVFVGDSHTGGGVLRLTPLLRDSR
jgi:hypothetical protein